MIIFCLGTQIYRLLSQYLFEMLQLTGVVSERSDDGRSRCGISLFPYDSCDPGGHWVGTYNPKPSRIRANPNFRFSNTGGGTGQKLIINLC